MAKEVPDPRPWLALRLVPGVGSVMFARLLKAFGSPEAALDASRQQLLAVPGLGDSLADAVLAGPERDPAKELARLSRLGGRVLTLPDPEYPPLLRDIFAPPPLLFVRGEMAGCRQGGVALVGTRTASHYALAMAKELAKDLAQAGLSVISGLARGVDGAAHRAALEAGGHSVGVLGCGLDVPYPPEHLELTRELASQGAVVTEFPLGTQPAAGNFPARNRVISGLSRAVVVVEAGIKSGALITARHARDQGREVYALPGPVGEHFAGCHQLIKEGAALLESAADILGPGGPLVSQPGRLGKPMPIKGLPPQAARLLEMLGVQPVHLDQLTRGLGLASGDVAALLLNLELAGLVRQLPGNNYVLS